MALSFCMGCFLDFLFSLPDYGEHCYDFNQS